jgi:hypothetical protein
MITTAGRFTRQIITDPQDDLFLSILRTCRTILQPIQHECTVNDLARELISGESQLWLCRDGFIVTRVIVNRFTGHRELFVWICYSESRNGIMEYYDDIKAIARAGKCYIIRFETQRDGFEKIAKKLGWRSMITYSFNVE